MFLYEKMKRATNGEFKYIDERGGCEKIAVRLRKKRTFGNTIQNIIQID
jgi:hypothetical protein